MNGFETGKELLPCCRGCPLRWRSVVSTVSLDLFAFDILQYHLSPDSVVLASSRRLFWLSRAQSEDQQQLVKVQRREGILFIPSTPVPVPQRQSASCNGARDQGRAGPEQSRTLGLLRVRSILSCLHARSRRPPIAPHDGCHAEFAAADAEVPPYGREAHRRSRTH